MSIGDSGNTVVFVSDVAQPGNFELRMVIFLNVEQEEHHGDFDELSRGDK